MKPLKNHLIIKTLRYIKNRYKVDPVKILNSWYKEYYIIQVQKKNWTLQSFVKNS